MISNLKYLTPQNDLLSFEEEDGRVVVLELGMQGFGSHVALGPAPYTPPDAEPLTATALLAALAARRYAAEESGTTFNSLPLATDRTSQAKITAAYVKAAGDPEYMIAAWKFAPGVFAPLDAATIIAAADAMEAHVQACFANEAAITAQILAAETPDDLAAIDIEQGWP